MILVCLYILEQLKLNRMSRLFGVYLGHNTIVRKARQPDVRRRHDLFINFSRLTIESHEIYGAIEWVGGYGKVIISAELGPSSSTVEV